MSSIAIRATQLSKSYHIYNNPQDRLKQSLWGGSRQFYQEFEALKSLSFVVNKGDTVGIVGSNGCGKSTLLQIICGTLTPTSGTIETYGKIAALLELGAGFNPEFTGRENIYMSGAIMGLSQEQIRAYFDRIVDFADIGFFLEQPVKTYSSGMFVRLAFAVNICLEPDILIVDEALAVGDEAFQRKCFARIHDFQAQGGTILLVTHSMPAIVELCNRAFLIDRGEIILDLYSPKVVASSYHKLLLSSKDRRETVRNEIINHFFLNTKVSNAEQPSKPKGLPAISSPESLLDPTLKPESTVAYESQGAWISNPRILNLKGDRVNLLSRGQDYIYTYRVKFDTNAYRVKFGMVFKTISGIDLGGTGTSNVEASVPKIAAGSEVDIQFRFTCILLPGTYFINAGTSGEVIIGERIFLHRLIDAVMFKIQEEDDLAEGGFVDFGITGEITLVAGTMFEQ